MQNPVTAVWELTMGCNMRCKHCGSSCTTPLADELTPEESIKLCDEIGSLGLKWITLSGGEPLLRTDWSRLVRRLRDHDVVPNIITNGWLCTEEVVELAKQSGVGTFAVSLDGPQDVHDFIRAPGSFRRVLAALGIMADKGVSAGVITTVHQRNIDRLGELRDILIDLGVDNWQLQIGLPMGNFGEPAHRAMVLPPEGVQTVVDFIHGHSLDERMRIYPADCLGYYSVKDVEARTRAYRSSTPVNWCGCNAGKRSFGVLHNGDIVGCTSIRDRAFIEGNIRSRPLCDIWNDPGAFSWSRGLTKEHLGGNCQTCHLGSVCLGGCPNTRLTTHGTIHSGNEYCLYSIGLSRAKAALVSTSTAHIDIRAVARRFIENGEYQLAGMALEHLLALDKSDPDLYAQYGFVSYSLGNLARARDANREALLLDPKHVYAMKGLGVVLHAMGEVEDGIAYLQRAVAMTNGDDMDSYHDLAVLYIESGRKRDARVLLERAKNLSPPFAEANAALYQLAD
ncbi:MAG: radical SAM protein [Myxococcales bacterium]